METANIIFITGGVRSGKSNYAEALAERLSEHHNQRNLHYIACGVASDPEMHMRIQKHQQKRAEALVEWETWEQPHSLRKIADEFSNKDILVLDCLTTLVNNYMFLLQMTDENEIISCVLQDIDHLSVMCGQFIIVSNEVFQGMPHSDSLTLKYQRMLGMIHQHIVEKADHAYLIESDIPICKKGAIL